MGWSGYRKGNIFLEWPDPKSPYLRLIRELGEDKDYFHLRLSKRQ